MKSDNFLQKIFSGIGIGNSRVPLKSNIFNTGRGYSPIGSTGGRNSAWNGDRQSPLLGNAQPSNRLSGYYDRVSELKGYQLLDISQMCVNFFRDYVINFIVSDSQQIVSIVDDEGNINEQASERINNALSKQLNIVDFIKSHIDETIFFGTYSVMLGTKRDDTGHLAFEFVELYDPVSTVIKRKRGKDGEIEEVCLARGDDGTLYEIPDGEFFTMGTSDLRLINDLEEGWKDGTSQKPKYDSKNSKDEKNRDKVIRKESYLAGEPLFYSLILKVKELVIKELLISLISLRDLASPSLFSISIDKGVSLEAAQELCARIQKLSTNYNELSSFLTSQFSATSFIEQCLTQNVKFFPDFNGTVSNKGLITLDKLSDKLLEILQVIDNTRNSILGAIGLPSTLGDGSGASGTKWAVLQQSERANSKVSAIMNGIKNSIIELAGDIYFHLYNEELDPANIKLHFFEKSTVEYNNQINQSESIGNLIQGITGIIQQGIQTLDGVAPLIDPEKFLNYLQTQIKNIDPSSEFITEETIRNYMQLWQAKVQAQQEQIAAGGMM